MMHDAPRDRAIRSATLVDVFGGARISTKHVLALTNAANATAQDIASLAKSAQKHVEDAFGITLEPDGGSTTPTLESLYTLGKV
mgnify:CR=1 FL=1